MYNYPLFASKPTFARIDFLGQGGRLGAKKPFLVLKFVPKIIQSGDVRNLLLAKWGANLLGREQALRIGKTCRLEV